MVFSRKFPILYYTYYHSLDTRNLNLSIWRYSNKAGHSWPQCAVTFGAAIIFNFQALLMMWWKRFRFYDLWYILLKGVVAVLRRLRHTKCFVAYIYILPITQRSCTWLHVNNYTANYRNLFIPAHFQKKKMFVSGGGLCDRSKEAFQGWSWFLDVLEFNFKFN